MQPVSKVRVLCSTSGLSRILALEDAMRLFISVVVLSMFCSSLAVAAPKEPKEKPRKGNPEEQEVLDLTAKLTSDIDTRADGNVSDWGAFDGVEVKSTLLSGEYDYDWTGPKDLSAKIQAQYGAEKIYFYVNVTDNAVVSKKKQWKSDRVEIWLVPEAEDGKALGSPRGVSMDIGPMVDGDKALIKWVSGRGADGLEGAGFVGEEGYDFEVSIAYSALAKTSPVMNGYMRYCVIIRDWDQDDPNEDEATLGTCPIDPKKPGSIKREKMGRIRLALRDSIWTKILNADREAAKIEAEWTKVEADIAGTSMPEIIAFAGDTLLIAGMGLNGYAGLTWNKISLDSGFSTAVPQITFEDVDGDKQKEVIVTRNEHCNNGGMNADRSYIFKQSSSGIKFIASFIREQRYDSGSDDYVRNHYKYTKNGIVQTLDKSSKSMQACELKGMEDTAPMLMPGGDTSATIPYL